MCYIDIEYKFPTVVLVANFSVLCNVFKNVVLRKYLTVDYFGSTTATTVYFGNHSNTTEYMQSSMLILLSPTERSTSEF